MQGSALPLAGAGIGGLASLGSAAMTGGVPGLDPATIFSALPEGAGVFGSFPAPMPIPKQPLGLSNLWSTAKPGLMQGYGLGQEAQKMMPKQGEMPAAPPSDPKKPQMAPPSSEAGMNSLLNSLPPELRQEFQRLLSQG